MWYIRRLMVTIVTPLLAWSAGPLSAQTTVRLWAAQTGPDQVSLSWDSVPGALQYRIYLGAPGTVDEHLPAARLGATARGTMIVGVQRFANGSYLLATGTNDRPLVREPFNSVTRPTSYSPVTPPAGVSAAATGSNEVTVSWAPVPGATAVAILRAVAGSGFQRLCDICSTEGRYVDAGASLGFPHTYSVAAIFPWGRSQATASNQVTPGVPDGGTSGTTTTTATGTQPWSYGAVPTSSTSTHTATAPTTTAPTTTTTTTTTTTPTQTTTTTTPTQTTLGGVVGGVITSVGGTVNTVMGTLSPPPSANAAPVGPGAVQVSWQASPASGIKVYLLSRRINGGSPEMLDSVSASMLAYTDRVFPSTMFGSGSIRVSYVIAASTGTVTSRGTATSEVPVQPPTTSSTSTAAACKLDYMRADNMWAAFGRPDGLLGTETISLPAGQDKVFVTDWKYEKMPNDGTNYYGSHLRIATNTSSRTLRLQLRTLTLTGLTVFLRTGSDTFWIKLAPGARQLFQADLMEVFCES